MDLFKIIVDEDKLHPNFKRLMLPVYHYERKEIESWGEGFQDRDGKFIIEFQTTFNSSFWELYLHNAFNELGFEHNYNYPTPDFSLKKDELELVAEAVISEPANGDFPEYAKLSFEAKVSDEEYYNIISNGSVRLLNSISKKYKKYKEHYEHLDHVKEKPFIICVAPFDHPNFFLQGDRAIRRVLYGYDMPLVVEDGKGKWRQVGESYLPKILKENSSVLELGLFQDEKMKEISAVIFSITATTSKVAAIMKESDQELYFLGAQYDPKSLDAKPFEMKKEDYKENILDGLYVFLNPFAERVFDLTPFLRKEIAVTLFEPVSNRNMTSMKEGFLLQRRTLRIGKNQIPKDALWVDTSKFKLPEYHKHWEGGVLVPVYAEVFPFDSNHMAHYKDWTVLIVRCTIDNDWGYLSIRSKCFDVPTFMKLNSQLSYADSVLGKDFFSTKELAFESCKKIIETK